MECPFCKESDFDLVGLKHHINMGWCEVFNHTIDVSEEQKARQNINELAAQPITGDNTPKTPPEGEITSIDLKTGVININNLHGSDQCNGTEAPV
jgi:hypothetical protein